MVSPSPLLNGDYILKKRLGKMEGWWTILTDPVNKHCPPPKYGCIFWWIIITIYTNVAHLSRTLFSQWGLGKYNIEGIIYLWVTGSCCHHPCCKNSTVKSNIKMLPLVSDISFNGAWSYLISLFSKSLRFLVPQESSYFSDHHSEISRPNSFSFGRKLQKLTDLIDMVVTGYHR